MHVRARGGQSGAEKEWSPSIDYAAQRVTDIRFKKGHFPKTNNGDVIWIQEIYCGAAIPCVFNASL